MYFTPLQATMLAAFYAMLKDIGIWQLVLYAYASILEIDISTGKLQRRLCCGHRMNSLHAFVRLGLKSIY